MIVVIGAAHLDILANADPNTPAHYRDRPGTVSIKPGGTGYNIVATLERHGHPAALVTLIPEHSYTGAILRQGLTACGSTTQFLHNVEGIPDCGFVAHLENGSLVAAVSSTSLDYAIIPNALIDRAVSVADIVVIDANLPIDTIRECIAVARQNNTPIIGTCVSESKMSRLTTKVLGERHIGPDACESHADIATGPIFLTITMNEREATSIRLSSATDLCQVFSAERVIVTHGSDGYDEYRPNGIRVHREIPRISAVNDVGAGDALVAALCAFAMTNTGTTNGPLIGESEVEIVRRFMKSVLRTS